MEQVKTEDWAGGSAGAFVFQSRPNHSLTRSQERLAFWSLAALCFATAIGFAWMGYWLILPFAGLEIGLLAWAFEVLRSREGDYETLMIEGDVVVLERHCGHRVARREMNRQWARVVCDCRSPGRNCRLSLSSHGRATEVGQYLSDEARLRLAAALRSRLQG
ncbi:MAG: DUF2244 domain-containing protein [Candidatus Thermoplasmatota archaeon]|nr:DUF2244 domain-containing protein [Candidatus Thermoplasmatota archaeon]